MEKAESAKIRPTRCLSCAEPLEYPICCTSCGALNPLPPLAINFFELFNIRRGYDLDLNELHRKYLALSRTIHPDMIDKSAPAMRKHSLTLSSELNRAYETLKDPVGRAEYLLALAGGPLPGEDQGVPGEMLAEVMVLREEMEAASAAHDGDALHALRKRIAARQSAALKTIAELARKLEQADEQELKRKKDLRRQINTIKYWNNLSAKLPAGEPAGSGPQHHE